MRTRGPFHEREGAGVDQRGLAWVERDSATSKTTKTHKVRWCEKNLLEISRLIGRFHQRKKTFCAQIFWECVPDCVRHASVRRKSRHRRRRPLRTAAAAAAANGPGWVRISKREKMNVETLRSPQIVLRIYILMKMIALTLIRF